MTESLGPRRCQQVPDVAGRLLQVLAGAVVAWTLMASTLARAADEANVHAAYVINFIRYSRWPDPQPVDQPYVIAVLGPAGTAATFRTAAGSAAHIGGREFVVRIVPVNPVAPALTQAVRALQQDLQGVHVVYVAASYHGWNRAIVAAVAGRPVLTVGIGHEFVEAGGMFGLFENGGRVSFGTNENVIRNASVSISARVLVLARPFATQGG